MLERYTIRPRSIVVWGHDSADELDKLDSFYLVDYLNSKPSRSYIE